MKDYSSKKFTAFYKTINNGKEKKDAKKLHDNWEDIQKIGVLVIEPDDKVRLTEIMLKDPVSKWSFTHHFYKMLSIDYENRLHTIAVANNGKYLALLLIFLLQNKTMRCIFYTTEIEEDMLYTARNNASNFSPSHSLTSPKGWSDQDRRNLQNAGWQLVKSFQEIRSRALKE